MRSSTQNVISKQIILHLPQSFLFLPSIVPYYTIKGNVIIENQENEVYQSDNTNIPIINDTIDIQLDKTFTELPRQTQKYHTINRYLTSELSQSILKGESMNDVSILSESLSGQQIDDIITRNIDQLKLNNISWKLYKTESEITYNYYWSPKTDYIITITVEDKEYRVAVEVKRIPYIPYHHEITENRVYSILNRANYASIHSNKNVEPEDSWSFQMLHIITDSDQTEQHVKSWFKNETQPGFSLVMITMMTGDSDLIL